MPSKAQKNRGYLLPETVTGHQLMCVSMMIPRDDTYIAAFKGQILELTKHWKWEKSGQPDDRRAADASRYWRDLIEDTMVFDDCNPETSGCIEFAPNSAIIEWLPMDPFKAPDEVPDGYVVPPWYVAPALNLIGAKAGDVVTDVLRITSGSTWFGDLLNPPRFRVSINGTGVVELHLVNIIQTGGMAQIQVDGDLLSLRYVDLNRDVASVPGESQDVIVIPIEITTPGDHFIDVTMLPNVDDSLIPIRFGGGLRKVVLCGFDQPPPENPETPMFRFQEENCMLQWSSNGGLSWNDVPGWESFAMACFQGAPGEQGPAGEPGETGTPGEPGQDGSSTDFPTETPGEDGDGKRCDIASYLAELILPSINQQTIAAREDTASRDQFLAALITIPAVIVTTIATGGTALPGWLAIAAAGAAAGGAAWSLELAYDASKLADIGQEATPQFWQDVKCEIYCVMPDDGIITAAVLSQMAAGVSSLSATYPAAAPAIASLLEAASEDARGAWSVIGAMYEGSNCDICDCEIDCAATAISWSAVGATPAAWSSPAIYPAGVTNPYGFTDDATIRTAPNYAQMTRLVNDTWREAVSNGAHQVAVKYTFDEPCLVKRVGFQTFSTTANTKLHWVILELVGGEKRIITYRRNNASTPQLQVLDYTLPVPMMATAVYYCYHTGINPGSVSFQQSDHWLNSDRP